MNKGNLVELVQKRLEGGDYGDAQFTDAEVSYYIETAFNNLYQTNYKTLTSVGHIIPSGSKLLKFNVACFLPIENEHPYGADTLLLELPTNPIDIPMDMGLYKIHPMALDVGGANREFIPIYGGSNFINQFSAGAPFFTTQDTYEWVTNKMVVLRQRPAANPKVQAGDIFCVYIFANDFKSLSDTDPLNYSPDLFNEIITMTVQLLTGVSQDMTNDLNPNN